MVRKRKPKEGQRRRERGKVEEVPKSVTVIILIRHPWVSFLA